jgi:hypothetical protein
MGNYIGPLFQQPPASESTPIRRGTDKIVLLRNPDLFAKKIIEAASIPIRQRGHQDTVQVNYSGNILRCRTDFFCFSAEFPFKSNGEYSEIIKYEHSFPSNEPFEEGDLQDLVLSEVGKINEGIRAESMGRLIPEITRDTIIVPTFYKLRHP